MKLIYNDENETKIKDEIKRLGGIIFIQEFESLMKHGIKDINRFIEEYGLAARIETTIRILSNTERLENTLIFLEHRVFMTNHKKYSHLADAIKACSPKDVNKNFYIKTVLNEMINLSKNVYNHIRLTNHFDSDVFSIEGDNNG